MLRSWSIRGRGRPGEVRPACLAAYSRSAVNPPPGGLDLSTLTSRATHAHPTSPRSTGFCAIWDCISSSSSSPPGGLDLNSSNSGCARHCYCCLVSAKESLTSSLQRMREEVAVLFALVRRHRRAVSAAVRRAVDDEVPGAVEEEAGPAAVRRVPPGLLDALPVLFVLSCGVFYVEYLLTSGEVDPQGALWL